MRSDYASKCSLPFLFRNRQIISEATPIFAGANMVHLKGKRYCSVVEPRRAHLDHAIKHHGGLEYNYRIEMPPVAIRPLLKRITITLHAPYWSDFGRDVLGRFVRNDEHIWAAEDHDWLYPIREMKLLGFTLLEHLSIKVVYEGYEYARMDKDFLIWTRDKISGMIDAKELDILFCRARDKWEISWKSLRAMQWN